MQHYYSKNTVLKLRARAECAEQNFESTLKDCEQLGKELSDLKAYAAEKSGQLDKERNKNYELTRKIDILEGRRAQQDTCMAQVKRGATERAHAELHRVRATETSAVLLQRAIGNAQGILAAALDANNGFAPAIDLYQQGGLATAMNAKLGYAHEGCGK